MKRRRTIAAMCDCRDRCGDMHVLHDRLGAVCKALPGSWATQHEHRPLPSTPPYDATCRTCGYPVDLHAREAP